MSANGIVIRIHAGGGVDWSVDHPEQLTFDDVLVYLCLNKMDSNLYKRQLTENDYFPLDRVGSFYPDQSATHQIMQDDTSQAFEYEDDEGERITVRGDDELKAMISFYLTYYEVSSEGLPPLDVYPKDVKSGKRNVEDLKISCGSSGKAMDTDVDRPPPVDTMQCSPIDAISPGSKKMSGDVRKILEGGQIQDCDVKLIQRLGSGQTGTVFRAQHTPSGHVMAVKVIALSIDASEQSQIISELEVLHRCKSPSIICFYGAYFTEGKISICTEYMDGGSLDRYGVIPELILGQIAVSIVKGLQYLWTLKVMHRDLKPSNILVNTQGHVKLCDFGVSVQLIASVAKTYIGTLSYMAPERLKGEDYRMMAEVWSLGVLLFELVSGRFPYKSASNVSSSPADLINSIVQKDPPQLPLNAFSPTLVDFVSKCMTKDPAGRPEPHSLMHHPFIQSYLNRDSSVIAAWVQQTLEQKRSA